MALVGVISDTHGSLAIPACNALADCDLIVHAGDIGDPDILADLRTLAPVQAVLGNNDAPEYGDVGRYARFSVEGIRFLVAHKPNHVDISSFGSSAVAPGDPIPRVRIYGHTHLPVIETGGLASPSDLLMNPGSASYPRGGNSKSIGKIKIEDAHLVSAWIETLDGRVFLRHDWTTRGSGL